MSDYIVKLSKLKCASEDDYHSVEITVNAADRVDAEHFADDLRNALNIDRPYFVPKWSSSVRAAEVSGG